MHGLPGITGTPVLNGVHQRLGERQVSNSKFGIWLPALKNMDISFRLQLFYVDEVEMKLSFDWDLSQNNFSNL
jgi:hypothetical protein